VPSFPSSDISTPLWLRQDDPVARLNRGANDLGAFAQNVAVSGLQREALLPDNPVSILGWLLDFFLCFSFYITWGLYFFSNVNGLKHSIYNWFSIHRELYPASSQ
jgi:hypothetical protein